MPTLPNSITVVAPGKVEVREEPDDVYLMNESDALAVIETVRMNRKGYADDFAWYRRLEHYESVLAVIRASLNVMNQGVNQ